MDLISDTTEYSRFVLYSSYARPKISHQFPFFTQKAPSFFIRPILLRLYTWGGVCHSGMVLVYRVWGPRSNLSPQNYTQNKTIQAIWESLTYPYEYLDTLVIVMFHRLCSCVWLFPELLKIFIEFMHVFVCECTCLRAHMHCSSPRTTCGNQSLPPILWIPRINCLVIPLPWKF